MLKKQDVILGVKWYFDLVKITSNMWMVDLQIIVISNEKKHIYSEENVATCYLFLLGDMNQTPLCYLQDQSHVSELRKYS